MAQRQSPVFGMFNNYPTWTETLAPGEEATLHVAFDPNFHGPGHIGFMVKVIRITAEDLDQPLAEMHLRMTVVEER